MTNFEIPNLPDRSSKPRKDGLTMVLDKGLSFRQAEDLLSVATDYIDFIKLGWCTAYLTPALDKKLELYRDAGLNVFFGGTLFETFVKRNAIDAFKGVLEKFKMKYVEISNGSLDINEEEKLELINQFKQDYNVLSEVGSKDNLIEMAPYLWVDTIKKELSAGADLIITEARESGTVGIYRSTGEVRSGLIEEILRDIKFEQLIFESPHKAQQTWFINKLGTNVNLGNIDPQDIIGLETLRLGLRSDTFHTFI